MRSCDLSSAAPAHDLIVVGAGVAGLRAAIEAAEGGLTVALLAKDSAHDSNTEVAQGGVAVALSDEDQVGLHYQDTLSAGDGLCDEGAVAVLVGEGPRYITQLIDWGAQFDREGSRLAFTREGAHSARRILHAQGDATGREILRALWRKASTLETITFLPHSYSVDATVEDGVCRGLRVLDETNGNLLPLESPCVVLATGGLGRIYRETTNPPQATGDGIALAWRAGALLRDMEFVQFHPTSLHVAGAPRFLLSEALRGEGGLLRAEDGARFMTEVDPRAELAPRDIVARAIFLRMARTGADHVLLDMTHLDPLWLKSRFPRIHATCLSYGIDLGRDPVPVAPAAHYVMGGVATDLEGRTTVQGLYAAGEVACTGVHGANRLASNSLLEGLVFGARTGRAVLADRAEGRRGAAAQAVRERARTCPPGEASRIVSFVQEIAWDRLGIVREGKGIRSAVDQLEELLSGMALSPVESGPRHEARSELEACNMATAALLVARSAIAREESRGAHYRSDYPDRNDARFGRSSYIAPGMAGAVIDTAPAVRPES